MPHRYAVTSLVTLFLASACVVIFCFVVDPYKLFPSIPGLSPGHSVDLFYKLRLHKPYAVERVQPSVLIIGSSRAAVLSPQLLESTNESAYNASLPGATLREVRRMVEHAHAIQPLKTVLIGVDHQMFQEGYSVRMVFDEPHRYRTLTPSLKQRGQHISQIMGDYWRSLFSVDAIMDSVRVLYGTGRSHREFRADGTWDLDGNSHVPPYERYSRLTRQIYSDETSDEPHAFIFDEMTDLLNFTDANDIQVILLVSPMHGLLMQTLVMAGSWSEYLGWQRELVMKVAARKSDTEVYGLEDKPALVLEAIDAPQPLFRDGVHYTQKAGMEILSCLTGPCDSSLQPTRLDSQSIDSYLEQVEALRLRYLQENPDDIAKAKKWVKLGKRKAKAR